MESLYIDLSKRITFKSYTKEQIQIVINIICISMGFMLLFASYNSMESLQTSINAKGGLGNISLYLIYGTNSFSNLFLPTMMVRYLGTRRTLALCMLCYSLYIAMQFYPSIYTLGPSAVILGLAAAPLWISQGSYLSIHGRKLANLLEMDPGVVLTRIFSMFAIIMKVGVMIGNVISSAVLSSSGGSNNNGSTLENLTCGVHFCPVEQEESFTAKRPSEAKIYLLSTIYLTFSLLASVIILLFLNPVENFSPELGNSFSKEVWLKNLAATLKRCKSVKVLLLFPMTFVGGSKAAFILSEYNQAFVGCTIGIGNIGYVMTTLAVAAVLGMLLASVVVQFAGRIVLISASALVQVAVMITMLLWNPSPDHYLLFFVIPFLWGISGSVWGNQMKALNAIIFAGKETPSFSATNILFNPGFFFTFFTSSYLCMEFKIWYLLIGTLIGMVCYYILEFIVWKTSPEKEGLAPEKQVPNKDP